MPSDTCSVAESLPRKASGPRTSHGKRRSRRNSLLHGIFAKQLFLDGERPEDFDSLHESQRECRRPEGGLEDWLLWQLAMLMWRKVRLFKAETAEIAKAAKSMELDRLRRQVNFPTPSVAEGFLHDLSGPDVLRCVIELLADLREDFEQRAFDQDKDVSTLRQIYGFFNLKEGFPRDYIATAYLAADPEKCKDKSLNPGAVKKLVVELIDAEIKRITHLGEEIVHVESDRWKNAMWASSIPPQDVMDRLLRYECHLSREIERTLRLLEQVQKERRGSPAPPTIKVARG